MGSVKGWTLKSNELLYDLFAILLIATTVRRLESISISCPSRERSSVSFFFCSLPLVLRDAGQTINVSFSIDLSIKLRSVGSLVTKMSLPNISRDLPRFKYGFDGV